MTQWTAKDIPDLNDKVVIVTGGNSGLGFYSVRDMAAKGAIVIMASRNPHKAKAAITEIKTKLPDAKVEHIPLDLADLDSIRQFAEKFRNQYMRLDILMNNAGVMAIPHDTTADGFEMQFGTNHLGHFALTGHLFEMLLSTSDSRVVNVSSGYHHQGEINFDDLMGDKGYQRWTAYAQSKLANLLFTLELERKLKAMNADTISVGAHPGYAATNLQPNSAGQNRFMKMIMSTMNMIFAQSAEMGALPQLYAATAPDVKGGEYYGPTGMMEMRGHPGPVEMNKKARDKEVAERLWKVSEELTGVEYGDPIAIDSLPPMPIGDKTPPSS